MSVALTPAAQPREGGEVRPAFEKAEPSRSAGATVPGAGARKRKKAEVINSHLQSLPAVQAGQPLERDAESIGSGEGTRNEFPIIGRSICHSLSSEPLAA
jgi:hypothetical protein